MDNQIITVILGGGEGSRLFPLTQYRAKPAVPIAGAYRLIDVPLSNCINSGLRRIFVITQFNSESLNRHIAQAFHFDRFSGGHVDILAASLSPRRKDWYRGTADAVRQNLEHLEDLAFSHILILSGDHLYRMDYRELFDTHVFYDADATIAAKMVPRAESASFGVIEADAGRVTAFHEKPKPESVAHLGEVIPMNMGIYLFKREALFKALRTTEHLDFGQHVLPAMAAKGRLFIYPFEDFWADVGTIESYYQVNLSLTRSRPPFRMVEPGWPFFSRARFLPLSDIHSSSLSHVLVSEGCTITGSRLRDSLVGLRSIIRQGCDIRETLVMGNDFYEKERAGADGVPLGIGKGCVIRKAIVDKNARIGEGCRIVNAKKIEKADGPCWHIRDGIVVIPKGAVVASGTVI
jgi:glucose-1-phosphate adenylyltransferase